MTKVNDSVDHLYLVLEMRFKKGLFEKSNPYTELLVIVTVKPLSMDKIFQRSPFQSHFKYLVLLIDQSAIN